MRADPKGVRTAATGVWQSALGTSVGDGWQHGIRPVTLPRGAAASFNEAISAVNAEVICVSAVPPQADRHLRFICRRLRATFPEAKIVACLWTGPDATEVNREVPGTDAVCLTLAAAAEYVNQLQRTEIPTSEESGNTEALARESMSF